MIYGEDAVRRCEELILNDLRRWLQIIKKCFFVLFSVCAKQVHRCDITKQTTGSGHKECEHEIMWRLWRPRIQIEKGSTEDVFPTGLNLSSGLYKAGVWAFKVPRRKGEIWCVARCLLLRLYLPSSHVTRRRTSEGQEDVLAFKDDAFGEKRTNGNLLFSSYHQDVNCKLWWYQSCVVKKMLYWDTALFFLYPFPRTVCVTRLLIMKQMSPNTQY